MLGCRRLWDKRVILGMFIIAKTDAYPELVFENVEYLELDFTLCRGQDNAATMSYHLSGVYKRILYTNSKATFLNCDRWISLFRNSFENVEYLELDLTLCKGHTYDNAATMSNHRRAFYI